MANSPSDAHIGQGAFLDPVTLLTTLIELAMIDGRRVDALLLSSARDAMQTNEELLRAIEGHRFDTAHLVEKIEGYKPRLADQMLYEAAGFDRVEVSEWTLTTTNQEMTL